MITSKHKDQSKSTIL